MKNALILILGAAAGLVGGFGASMLQADAPRELTSAAAPAEITARLDDLESSMADLASELRRMKLARPLANAPVEHNGLVEGEGAVTESATPAAAIVESQLEEKILDVVAERERVEREEREERRAAAAAERETEFLNRLETELGLNTYQRDELARILKERREAMDRFRENVRSGELDRSSIRDEMSRMREASQQEIKDLLTVDQFEAFESRFADRRGGPSAGGFGSGGRGRRGR